MDFDNMRGWHWHPFGKADEHERVNEINIEEIFTFYLSPFSFNLQSLSSF
jgi:hypothetical protein